MRSYEYFCFDKSSCDRPVRTQYSILSYIGPFSSHFYWGMRGYKVEARERDLSRGTVDPSATYTSRALSVCCQLLSCWLAETNSELKNRYETNKREQKQSHEIRLGKLCCSERHAWAPKETNQHSDFIQNAQNQNYFHRPPGYVPQSGPNTYMHKQRGPVFICK